MICNAELKPIDRPHPLTKPRPQLVKTPEGKESPGALAGVPPAAVLIAVAGEHTLRLRYEESIGRYGRGRNEEMGVGGAVACSMVV